MTQFVLFTWHVRDNNMFENCLRSLRKHSNCHIVVFTDNLEKEIRGEFEVNYDVMFHIVKPEQMVNRRAACKVETFCDFICSETDNFDEILVADADLLFLSDPFKAFKEYDINDVGLTTRDYKHWSPVNGGVMFFKSWVNVWDFFVFP